MTTHIHYPHFHVPGVVRRHVVLFLMLAVAVVVGAIAGIWFAQRSSPTSESATTDWAQEYNVDSPLVTYADPGPVIWVGAEANLDPDIAVWGQSEYNVDSSLVTYADPGPVIWVGAEANLDPDIAVWGQPEYNVDTPLVTYADDVPTYWIGTEAGLDPDE